jgi:hypothetical protein
MKQWFKDRFDEPTSWIAFAGLLQFAGLMTKSDELPIIADAVSGNANALASGDFVGAGINIISIVALALGFGKREKAR